MSYLDEKSECAFWLTDSPMAPFAVFRRARGVHGVRRAFVFCGPFAEEKNKSQRLLVDMARAVSARGWDVLMLDYGGTGDSLGRFEHATIRRRKNDIRHAVEFCRREAGAAEIGLLGLRLGATLAGDVAEEVDGVTRLVLLAPVADAGRHLRNTLRSKLVKELLTDGKVTSRREGIVTRLRHESIDLDGFPVTPQLHVEMYRMRLAERLGHFRGKTLIVCASLKPKISEDSEKLAGIYRAFCSDVRLVKVLCEPVWNVHGVPPFEKIVKAVTHWIQEDNKHGHSDGFHARYATAAPRNISLRTRVDFGRGTEEARTFRVPGGFLSGILHVPSGKPAKVAVVMIHGWAGYRIGPHRMLVEAARGLCRAGYMCLRIDVRGRGHSSGRSGETSIATIYQDGRHAVEAIRTGFHPDRIVALGQCMGGSAAVALPGVDGSVSWSAPPVSQTAVAKTRKTWFMLRVYVNKLADATTWRKILGRGLNPALISEALFGHFRKRANTHAAWPHRQSEGPAQRARKSEAPCLFIFGGKDPDTPSARAMYEEVCRRTGRPAEFHIVEGANHSFYSMPWEREVLDKTGEWMRRHFPARAAEDASLPATGTGKPVNAGVKEG